MSSTIVITHGNCLDGLAAKWVISREFPSATFVDGHYGQPPPDVAGRDVIITDFSYPRKTLETMLSVCNSMILLDHHKSAEEDLRDLTHQKLVKVFNEEHSGARLAWDVFGGRLLDVPHLIEYVEDYDLWRFDFEETKEIIEYIRSFPQTIESIESLAALLDDDVHRQDAIEIGRRLVEFKRIQVEQAVAESRKQRLGGRDVWLTNVPFFLTNETCARLLELHPECPAACWYELANGHAKFGVRSKSGEALEIARAYGGGGHANAAGFVVDCVPWTDWM